MPFGTKFHEGSRPYQEGDFIFGIKASVDNFKARHSKKVPREAVLTTPVNTVRQLTNVIDDIMGFDDDRFDQNYHFLKSLLSHPKYHTSVVSRSLKLSTKDQAGGEGTNEAFRRKSKGALNFVIQQKGFLHFVLDGINQDNVVQKKNFSSGPHTVDQLTSHGSMKYRDVTGAELRWLYRHRNDPDTQASVQFWLEDKPCQAPWLDGPYRATWANYTPKSELPNSVDNGDSKSAEL